MIGTKQLSREINWREFMQKYGILLSLGLLCLALSLATDRFFTWNNLTNVLRQASINGIISIGMMLVILTRGIDLSVGSVLALSTIIGADLLKNEGMPLVQALGVALVIGGAAGAANGILVAWLNIPPFIATLGMMTFARGAAKYYTDGQPITDFDVLGQGFRFLGTAEPLGIPMPIIVMGIVYLLAYILLEHTPLGRYIFSLGDNEEAAVLSGLPVRTIKILVYVVAGVLSTIAGIILAGRIDSAQTTAGEMYEFDAIAAVVVGGTSFDGGEGTVFGTLIGVLIISIIDNGLNLMDVSSFYQDIVKGAVIALALLLHRIVR